MNTFLFAFNLETVKEKDAFTDLLEQEREAWEDTIDSRWLVTFADQVSLATEAMLRQGTHEAALEMFEASSSLVEVTFKDMWLDVGSDFAEQAFGSIKSLPAIRRMERKQEEEGPWLEALLKWIANESGVAIKAIDETTLAAVREILAEATRQGLGLEKAARMLQEEWEGLSRIRARRIARTEVVCGSNKGTMEGARSTAEEFDFTMTKEWLSVKDGNERPTHDTPGKGGISGVVIPMEDLFYLGGPATVSEGGTVEWSGSDPCDYPGDAQLPADERISCRCTTVNAIV